MKVLLAPTEDFIKKERDSLTADAVDGSNVVLNIINSANYAVNDYIVVGIEGSDLAEMCKITAVATGQVTVATMLLSHTKDTPIVKYRYNKRKFYGSLTATGSYTELTGDGSPAQIQVNTTQGAILEYTGSTYSYFKSTYWNTTTSEESNIADANAVLADESVRYCSIYAIKKQAGLTNNPYITDGIVETYRKRAESEIKSILMFRYTLPLQRDDGTNEVPSIIENCATLLAAGYMDYQEFGKAGEGVKWLGEARGILNSIKKGNQRLLGSDDVELAHIDSANTVQSYPDTVDNNNGPIRMFTTKQRF